MFACTARNSRWDRIAPAEVRVRPLARTVIAEVARGGPAPASVAHLAMAIGLTR
ncbi:hypothetical protein [Micromonospora haikouensis]|uniref:hypothetical protein n=1 Tax=Micromonospora haikouensis TaxID=686309 RepID=UPI003D763016